MRVPLGKGQRITLPFRVFVDTDEAPRELRVNSVDLDGDCVWIYVEQPEREA